MLWKLKYFNLRTFLNKKYTFRPVCAANIEHYTPPGVSSFFVELGLVCAGWDILGRDKPAR